MKKNNSKNYTTQFWSIILGAICVAILAYGYFLSTNTSNNLAYLLGYNLPICLIIWGIFQYTVGRKKGKAKAGIAFLSIFGALIIASFIGYSHQRKAALEAVSQIHKTYSNIISNENGSHLINQPVKKNSSKDSQLEGDYAQIVQFMKHYMHQIAAERKNYLRKLDDIGWSTILNANRIKNDAGFNKSRKMIKKARKFVKKYESNLYPILYNAKESIQNFDISNDAKQHILHSFEKSLKNSANILDKEMALKNKIIDEIDEIFDLLETKKVNGRYQKAIFYSIISQY